jgi:hypothetical protein
MNGRAPATQGLANRRTLPRYWALFAVHGVVARTEGSFSAIHGRGQSAEAMAVEDPLRPIDCLLCRRRQPGVPVRLSVEVEVDARAGARSFGG